MENPHEPFDAIWKTMNPRTLSLPSERSRSREEVVLKKKQKRQKKNDLEIKKHTNWEHGKILLGTEIKSTVSSIRHVLSLSLKKLITYEGDPWNISFLAFMTLYLELLLNSLGLSFTRLFQLLWLDLSLIAIWCSPNLGPSQEKTSRSSYALLRLTALVNSSRCHIHEAWGICLEQNGSGYQVPRTVETLRGHSNARAADMNHIVRLLQLATREILIPIYPFLLSTPNRTISSHLFETFLKNKFFSEERQLDRCSWS